MKEVFWLINLICTSLRRINRSLLKHTYSCFAIVLDPLLNCHSCLDTIDNSGLYSLVRYQKGGKLEGGAMQKIVSSAPKDQVFFFLFCPYFYAVALSPAILLLVGSEQWSDSFDHLKGWPSRTIGSSWLHVFISLASLSIASFFLFDYLISFFLYTIYCVLCLHLRDIRGITHLSGLYKHSNSR